MVWDQERNRYLAEREGEKGALECAKIFGDDFSLITHLNVECLDAVLVPVVAAAAADAPAQSTGFAVVASRRLPIDWFVVATHRAAHGTRAVNDSEYASADEFVAAVAVHERHRHSDEVEIASDRKRSMICDSD